MFFVLEKGTEMRSKTETLPFEHAKGFVLSSAALPPQNARGGGVGVAGRRDPVPVPRAPCALWAAGAVRAAVLNRRSAPRAAAGCLHPRTVG